MIFNENMSVRETLPKFLKDALGQSRHGRIAQNQEGVDRCNAEIGANEDIANNGNEQPEIRERAREKVEEEDKTSPLSKNKMRSFGKSSRFVKAKQRFSKNMGSLSLPLSLPLESLLAPLLGH